MMVNKKEFGLGLFLFIGFWVVFIIMMSPVFKGMNLLDYMDNLYNTISKDSAYYIPAVMEKAEAYKGREISVELSVGDARQAERIAALFRKNTTDVIAENGSLKITGDLGMILGNILRDSDLAFANDGASIEGKYGVGARQVLFDWWTAAGLMDKNLKKQKKFKEATMVYQVQAKAVEPSYNYFGIKAENIRQQIAIVVASLAGYVIYTLWYGFSILFMFEGYGFKLEH